MASDAASPDPRSKLHSLVRLSGPFLGADLPPAERRAQVLSTMPLAALARSAGSSWTRPSTALSLISKATTIVRGSTPPSATSPHSKQRQKPHNPVSTFPGEGQSDAHPSAKTLTTPLRAGTLG